MTLRTFTQLFRGLLQEPNAISDPNASPNEQKTCVAASIQVAKSKSFSIFRIFLKHKVISHIYITLNIGTYSSNMYQIILYLWLVHVNQSCSRTSESNSPNKENCQYDVWKTRCEVDHPSSRFDATHYNEIHKYPSQQEAKGHPPFNSTSFICTQ